MTNQTECRCEKKSCGCGKAEACICGKTCNCKPVCACGGRCSCAIAK